MKKLLILAAVLPLAANAAPLYSDNFDSGISGASWNVNYNTVDGANDSAANFAFDYSAVGIPAAPGGTSTIGLKMEPNYFGSPVTTSGNLPGLSVSPTGQSFAGDYTMRASVWMNYLGPAPAGGSGTTIGGSVGVLTNGTAAQVPGTATSTYFATTVDGGSSTDYRAYAPGTPAGYSDTAQTGGINVFAAPSNAPITRRNNTNAYYGAAFPAQLIPAAQTLIGPATQTGSAAAGTPAFAWHTWEVAKVDNIVTFTIDSLLISRIDVTGLANAGSNILLNAFDTNFGSSTSAASRTFTFVLFDNVTVDAIVVPEPSALALVGLAGAAALRRRRA